MTILLNITRINYETGVAEGVAKQKDERGFALNIVPVILDGFPKAGVSWPLQHYQSCDIRDEEEVRWLLNRVGDLIGRKNGPIGPSWPLKPALKGKAFIMPDQSLPDLLRREAVAPRRFDPRSATPFVNKSVSEETRRAYRRAVSDFFQFII